jgi:putative endopeptidase
VIGRAGRPGTVRAPSVYGPPVGRGLFLLNIDQDQSDPSRYAVYVGQGGLILPGPEYYLESQFADVRTACTAYVTRLLTLIAWPNAEERARQIIAFETRVAAVSWSHEQMRDVVRTYNPMTVAELIRLAPRFDWRALLQGAELGRTNRIVIDAKSAFPKIAAIFAETPLEILQAREAFAAADRGAGNLNADLGAAGFDFRGTMLGNGAFVGGARNMRAEQTAEATIGDIVAAFYVARYSSAEAKSEAEEMTANLKRALDARLEKLTWMSPMSRARAREKLAQMRINIGYPDRFDDYQGLSISDQDLYGNVARAAAYDWQRQVRSLTQPFDRSGWTLTPEYPTYNYNPTTNSVEIPASLLQPPFFDVKADEAVNYGAIGSQIGQMMVVAFTNQGSPYDGDGRLKPWLVPADAARYATMSQNIGAQYSAVEPLPSLHLKGELLLDEAISDLGGVQIALDAYHASLQGKAAAVIDGYTGDQRFFLGRAKMWRAKFSPTFTRNQVATGFNAPPFMRVNGPLANIDAWYEAFGVKPGDKMYVAPDTRVRIW